MTVSWTLNFLAVERIGIIVPPDLRFVNNLRAWDWDKIPIEMHGMACTRAQFLPEAKSSKNRPGSS